MKFGIQKSGLSKSKPGAKSRPMPPGPTYSQSARSGFATLELAAVVDDGVAAGVLGEGGIEDVVAVALEVVGGAQARHQATHVHRGDAAGRLAVGVLVAGAEVEAPVVAQRPAVVDVERVGRDLEARAAVGQPVAAEGDAVEVGIRQREEDRLDAAVGSEHRVALGVLHVVGEDVVGGRRLAVAALVDVDEALGADLEVVGAGALGREEVREAPRQLLVVAALGIALVEDRTVVVADRLGQVDAEGDERRGVLDRAGEAAAHRRPATSPSTAPRRRRWR